MARNLDKYNEDLDKLLELGEKIICDFEFVDRVAKQLTPEEVVKRDKVSGTFRDKYQIWYTEARAVISQIVPDRLIEFDELYSSKNKNGSLLSDIQDWITHRGVGPADSYRVNGMLRVQYGILESAQARFESSLFDIRQMVQADLFDSELDTARELLNQGFLRGAGAVAGVVLEKHLGEIFTIHKLETDGENRTIGVLNDALKAANVIDVAMWRFIQRLGDLRNNCAHAQDGDPKHDEIEELIGGVDRILKTVF